MNFLNVGYGNVINVDKLISVVSAESAPIKRLIQNAKDEGMAIDATCGKKTKSALIMENNSIVLSSLLAETIASRLNQE